MAGAQLITSESVSEGHPDKMADQISDAILDAIIEQDPTGRVACETMVKTGVVIVAGEISTSAVIDTEQLVRDQVKSIGYDRGDYGFDGRVRPRRAGHSVASRTRAKLAVRLAA